LKVTPEKDSSTNDNKTLGIDDEVPRIWFKFNEGFSNAVRKTIFMKDLM